jgi:Flp pilus assembly protein TadB
MVMANLDSTEMDKDKRRHIARFLGALVLIGLVFAWIVYGTGSFIACFWAAAFAVVMFFVLLAVWEAVRPRRKDEDDNDMWTCR